MSRKPINWTDERIAKVKEFISYERAIRFRNEPGIIFDKETGWFLSNPDVVGTLYSTIRFDLLPDDMDFQEPDRGDYRHISSICGIDMESWRFWWCSGKEHNTVLYSSKTKNESWKGSPGFNFFVETGDIGVVYVDKTYEDCGFKNNTIKERVAKVLDLFMQLNLDPYIEGDDDSYELSEGDALNPDNTPVVDMQLVQETAEMIAPIMALARPIIEGMQLTADEMEELKKLIF